jgi:phosphatidylserine/phosphatidylglycerophosphate/cardiolipin synthase-like enzyme
MANFLTTNAISHRIEEIILQAKDRIILISPYLKIPDLILERLKDAAKRDIKITIIYGKNKLTATEEQKVFALNNTTIYYFENLHAKCYFNGQNMIITSMNIHEYSEKNNREMGILLNTSDDFHVFNYAYKEAMSIFKHAIKQEKGYCIRCLKLLKLNSSKPFCFGCYYSEKYKNKCLGTHCHQCGKTTESSLTNPICSRCKND